MPRCFGCRPAGQWVRGRRRWHLSHPWWRRAPRRAAPARSTGSSAALTRAEIWSCRSNTRVNFSSKLPLQAATPSAARSSLAVTRSWPSRCCSVPSTIQATSSTRAARVASCAMPAKRWLELMARTASPGTVDKRATRLSAMPISSNSSRPSACSGLKGSTASVTTGTAAEPVFSAICRPTQPPLPPMATATPAARVPCSHWRLLACTCCASWGCTTGRTTGCT